MRILVFCLALCAVNAALAAPAAQRTAVPSKRVLEARDVIVNVTTIKTIVRTAVPTTVYVPITLDDGDKGSSAVASTVDVDVTTVVTQTAVETQIIKTTVTNGQTIPVTLTTTAFEIELATETQVVQMTSTLFEQSTIVQTVQGVPVTQVVTVMQPVMTQAPAYDDYDDDVATTHAVKLQNLDTTTKPGTWPATSALPSTATVTKPGSLNVTNKAKADADSDASVDSSNTNTNNVSVTMSDSGSWVSENKWIIIGVAVAVILLVIIAIVAIALGHGHSTSSNMLSPPSRPAQQSVVVTTPASTGGAVSRPVANSLARPSRQRYTRIGESETENSSSYEDEQPPARARSTRSTAGRRAHDIGASRAEEANLGRRVRRAASSRGGSRSRG